MSLPNSSFILQRMRMKYPVLLLQLVCILVIRGVQLLQLRLVGIRTRVRGAQLLCIICVIDYNKHNNILASSQYAYTLSSVINIMHTTYIHNIYEYYHRVVLLAIMDIYAYYQYQSSQYAYTQQLWIVLEYSQSTLLKLKCVKHTAHELVYHGTFDSCAAYVRYVYTVYANIHNMMYAYTSQQYYPYYEQLRESSIMHTLSYALSFFIHFFMFRFIQTCRIQRYKRPLLMYMIRRSCVRRSE